MLSLSGLDREYVLDPDWPRLPLDMMWEDVCAISIGPDDQVYVLCRGPSPLLIFAADGRLLQAPEAGAFGQPHGGCVRPDGSWLITDEGTHALVVLNRAGEVIVQVGGQGPSDTGYRRLPDIHASIDTIQRAARPFNRPTGVAGAANGNLYVTDGYGNARVHCFDAEGKWLHGWGEPGTGPGQFRLPHGIHVDAFDRVWVADWGNNRLQVFDPDGSLMHVIEGFEGPAGIAMDCEGVVFVAEEEWRVSMLDQDMRIVARWDSRALPMAARTFVAPHCIAVDSNGDLYVGEVAKAYRGVSRGPRALQKLRRTR